MDDGIVHPRPRNPQEHPPLVDNDVLRVLPDPVTPPGHDLNVTITPFFRWFDLWVGLYIDRPNRTLYVCPVPMFGFKIEVRA